MNNPFYGFVFVLFVILIVLAINHYTKTEEHSNQKEYFTNRKCDSCSCGD